jgi:hypothetical protein
VKPFLEKERDSAVPKGPPRPVEESSPSPVPDVVSVPISQAPKDDTQPGLVKSEPEVDDES